MFELIGKVADFELAAQALGLEWMGSQNSDEDDSVPEDDEDGEAARSGGILYLTMPSLKGLKSLLAQWNRYKRNESPAADKKALWAMFGYLSDLRVWSDKDRIDPALVRYIDALVAQHPDRHVQVELDFWYRNEKERRDNSIETLKHLLVEVDGTLLDLVDINEIRYQGALVSLPAGVAKKLSDGNTLTRFDDIMTIRPQSIYSAELSPEAAARGPVFPTQPPTRRCITALLDGYPVSGHAALSERITIHEVDVKGEEVPAASRNHGTAMASLIVHGDLQSAGGAISRPVALIPVLTGTGKADNRETTPKGKLPIGVIYRALDALVKSRVNPELAGVTVINHSICDTFAPFVRRSSPWATLLDYFSHEHRLLFIVSAGNITESFPVELYSDLNEFNDALPDEREAALLNAINDAKATRGIFSPAEAINGITVGALHIDGASASTSVIDPYPNAEVTNLASAFGFGVNRSLKPDLVEQGGRFAAGCSNMPGGGVKIHALAAAGLGHQVASPSLSGDLTYVTRTAGTSNAAALISRACNQIADAVEDALDAEGTDWLTLSTRAVILKTLLTHGASWGAVGESLYEAFPPLDYRKHVKRKDNISKFFGYGRPDLGRIISGTENRITLLAEDTIISGKLHEYRVPIPTAMIKTKDIRSITLTLSWSTPVVMHSVDYRGVAVKLVNSEGKSGFWKGVTRRLQPNAATSERGTLLHVKLEGENLVKISEPDGIFVGVQAMHRHPSQIGVAVPYALAITLEMGQSQHTGIYEEVRQEIRTRAAAARSTNRIGTRA